MPFRFPLAALLKFRTVLEQREARALEQAVLAQRLQQSRLNEAAQAAQRHLDAISQALASGVAASDLHWSATRMRGVKRSCSKAEDVLDELNSIRDAQMRRYFAAHRELEIVQQLREDMLAEYSRQLAKNEQQLMDSLHLTKLVRERSKAPRVPESISRRSD